MANYLGGYIFFPQDGKHSVKELMTMTLQNIGTAESDYYAYILHEQQYQRVGLPQAETLAQLNYESTGRVDIVLSTDFFLSVFFEKNVKGYHAVGFQIYADSLDFPDEVYEPGASYPPAEPEQIRAFVQGWVSLCEQAQAIFGYFSKFPVHSDEEYRDKILPAAQQAELPRLLQTIHIAWLLYLAAELVTPEAEQQVALLKRTDALLTNMQIEKLPSGALFLRTTPDAKGALFEAL